MVDSPAEAWNWRQEGALGGPRPLRASPTPPFRQRAWPWTYLRWRWDMLRHWRRVRSYVKPGAVMVEVGTWRGASAERWLRQGVARIVMVDPYVPQANASWEGRCTWLQMDDAYRQARWRLSTWLWTGQARFLTMHSLEAVKGAKDESLDAVYLDGDHYQESVEADLQAWWPKVKPGGVLIGDDYLLHRWWGPGVIAAFDAFQPKDCASRRQHGRWMVLVKA